MYFNKNFLLGAATAAHQVEGNNVHSDCWAMENMKNSSYAEPSLSAVDHYNQYEEDIMNLSSSGCNAYRFSIEWARIETEEGVFNHDEIEHYRKVIQYCRSKKIEPILTLHHFSSPKWLIAKGGWESQDTIEYFRRYATYVIDNLGSEISYVCTINEANMGVQVAAIAKRYMLQMAESQRQSQNGKDNLQMGINLSEMMKGSEEAREENLRIFGTSHPETFTSPRSEQGNMIIIQSHMAARDCIRKTHPHIMIGLTLSLHDIQAVDGGEEQADKEWKDEFLQYLPFIEDDDFLGVQNYTRSIIGPEVIQLMEGTRKTQMGYEFYPEALENVIRKVAEKFTKDIIVTENGIATSDDALRIEFIQKALLGVKRCIDDGIPVKGYTYWSLLDNFEWQKGYTMTFGLIKVDRTTQMRYPKESLSYLGSLLEKDQ